MTSNGAVLEVSFFGISEHPTEQFVSIPKGLYEKGPIFFNQFTFILYRKVFKLKKIVTQIKISNRRGNMKKISFVLIVALALLLVGCETIENREFTVDKAVYGEDVVAIGLAPRFVKGFYGDGTDGYDLAVQNTTDSIIKVNWSKSSISYNGRVYVPFITGQKYIDHNNPMPPSVLASGGVMLIEVYSSDQPNYSSDFGWMMYAIPSYSSVVTICVEHNDKDTYYVFTINS